MDISNVTNVACRPACRQASSSTQRDLRHHLRGEKCEQDAKFAATAESETYSPPRMKKKGVRNPNADPQTGLFLLVALVVARHHQAQDEGREHGVPLAAAATTINWEQDDEHGSDLGFDHPIAVASEEPGRDLQQDHDHRERGDEEDREQGLNATKES